MAGWHQDVDVDLLDANHRLTHWRGSISFTGGAMKEYDGTAVGGLPERDYHPNVREPYQAEIETLILGNTKAEMDAFVADYAKGTVFDQPNFQGIDTKGRRYIVMNALPTYNYQANSTLKITLVEKGAIPAA